MVGKLAAFSAGQDGQPSSVDQEIVAAAISLHLILMFIIPMQMHFEALVERTPLRRGCLWWQRRSRRSHDDDDEDDDDD